MSAPDLTAYRTVHACLRGAAHRIAVAARTLSPDDPSRVRAFSTYWDGFAGELDAHHHIEDEFFFPALVERVPVAEEYLARIEGEHDHLDDLMARTTIEVARVSAGAGTETLVSLLDEVADHIDDHLDFEDADLLPLFERHFGAEEYEALDKRAMKSLGIGRQAAFTIPFILKGATPPQRLHLLAHAPLAFRVIYQLARHRHDRLEATALGVAPARAAVAA